MKKNKFVIKKNKNESELYYNLRELFIMKENPKTKPKFLLTEMYSNILINIIFLKCRYSKKTEKPIINFIKKYKNNIKTIIFVNNFNKIIL
jgi:hypothetical protein